MTQTELPKKRRRWGDDETNALLLGCLRHGVGNWKQMIQDSTLHFDRRTAVDLKDRFRTICPKSEYDHLYNQQNNNANYYLALNTADQIPVDRNKRRRRHLFSDEEDSAILKGVEKYGVSWARIAKDPQLNLMHRKGGDLRDRFRNKFPDRYRALGFRLESFGGNRRNQVNGDSSSNKGSSDDTALEQQQKKQKPSVGATSILSSPHSNNDNNNNNNNNS
ncbi:hypothetical protein BCR42DRAFT_412174 [Absidia repens]|uniref:Myb-like domain-containing protein n=1 Tax=Absidia repens TaxID=90262 RepID=A0A1X2IJ81_9FUNG|nr:hypothetical protein BCR42DRAFT_412174 [Absidia repens]